MELNTISSSALFTPEVLVLDQIFDKANLEHCVAHQATVVGAVIITVPIMNGSNYNSCLRKLRVRNQS